MKALFIGGTGIISSECSRLAVERGWELTVLNRGLASSRPPIEGAEVLVGDATDPGSVRDAVGTRTFDVVATFRAFTPEQVQADVDLFTGRTGQYVFISSASAYRKPVVRLPITEATALRNPFWQYSRDKIACEDLLVSAFREQDFPATVVRPSHTYDPTLIPLDAGWTAIDRMRRGRPTIVHGDGTSFWTLTHARDFAKGFVPLLGDPRVLGDDVHITTDEHLTWDAVAQGLSTAA
ncbi:MAG: NAD-dependent epimerase/dehydratase family protein, partial [Janthinobacterium lividum]